MGKLPLELEDPVDNVFYDFSNRIDRFFYNSNFTANDITTLSLITGLFSVYQFTKSHFASAGILYMVSYFFDCMDGNYARKYKQTSNFGHYYDNIKDFVVLLLAAFFVLKYHFAHNSSNIYTYIILLIMIIIISDVHYHCQEVYNNKTSYSTKLRCPVTNKDKARTILQYTRYFGTGVRALIISLFIGFTPYFVSLPKII